MARPLTSRPRRTRRAAAGVAVALLGLALTASAQRAGDETDARRWMITLDWGGDTRAWRGSVRLGPLTPGFRSEVTWLEDFEDGDRVVPGRPLARPDWALPEGLPGTPPTAEERAAVPDGGLLLQTRTEGDADGLCLVVAAPDATRLLVDLGGLRGDWSLAELAQLPRTVRADDGPGAVHARARALDALAPAATDHFGASARLVSLHTHTCFSTNLEPLHEIVDGMPAFVREVFWTDHNIGTPRRILAGDFEDAALVDALWEVVPNGVEVLQAGHVPTARTGSGAFGLAVRAGPRGGSAWAAVEKGQRAGQLYVALPARPSLRWAWQPREGTIATVEVWLSSRERLRYLSAEPPAGSDPTRDVVVETAPGTWRDVRVDLAADVARLFGEDRVDGILNVRLGVLCPPGETAAALFDDVLLDVPPPPVAIEAARDALAAVPGLRSHVGMEQSAWMSQEANGQLVPHLTFLVPDELARALPAADHALEPAEREVLVRTLQEHGGCVGVHHMQYDDHYAAFLDGGGLGADLFELGLRWKQAPAYATAAEIAARDAHGYPPELEDELFPLLVRWDRTTARGLLLTGYGAPDLNGPWARPSERSFNRWLTHVLPEGDDTASLLRALRAGRASACDARAPVVVTVSGGPGVPSGKLLVTDRPGVTLTARVTGAPPGSRVRWIEGAFVRATANDAGAGSVSGAAGRSTADAARGPADGSLVPPAVARPFDPTRHVVRAAAPFTDTLDVDARRGGFARVEVLDPAGRVVAVSNPVHVLPYWPTRWPHGRIAFDWAGLRLQGERGLVLEDARPDGDGGLLLRGTAHTADAQLAVGAPAAPRVEAEGATPRWDAEAGRLLVTVPEPGPFLVTIRPAEPVPTGDTADLLALPSRKAAAAAIDLGDPGSGLGALGEGFGPPLGAGTDGAGRPLTGPRLEFRLDVPPNLPTWLRLRRALVRGVEGAPFGGQLLVDGRAVMDFAAGDPLVFPFPALAVSATFTFTVRFDATDDEVRDAGVRFAAIELLAGDGVLEY